MMKRFLRKLYKNHLCWISTQGFSQKIRTRRKNKATRYGKEIQINLSEKKLTDRKYRFVRFLRLPPERELWVRALAGDIV